MAGVRRPGMDHDHYDWQPLPHRPPLRWPNNARVALTIVVSLEHYEVRPPADAYMPPNLPGGMGRGPYPDVRNLTMREYGNRVGVFRVMEVLDKHGIKATAAVDAAIAGGYPFLVNACLERGWELASHGQSVNRMITSLMSEDDERAYIRSSLQALAMASGRRPLGWLGPEYGESSRTPALLAAEGLRYVLDWPNDEQPYRMRVPEGQLVALPINLELDDVYAHWNRRVSMAAWARMVCEAFEVLRSDGARSGRSLVLHLHPWLIGQPFRIGYLDEVLGFILAQPDVWPATASEVVDWYLGAASA